ncbi:MAG: pyrimidine 5'-nucleotidase [Alphaproteobacteria bacterium]
MTETASLDRAEAWIFDLDNTLYPVSSKLFEQIDARMKNFIADYLDLPLDAAHRLQKQYFRAYGTTLSGLMRCHDVSPQEYLAFVHDIDVGVIAPNPELGAALDGLSGRKIIFTNASEAHARRVLARLGIEDRFEAIFDIAWADYVPKPDAAIYRRIVEACTIDATATVMIEDMARNLKPAADLGMTTVWIDTGSDWGAEGAGDGHIHHVTDDLAAWLSNVRP